VPEHEWPEHEWFCARAGAEIEAMASVVGGAPDIAADCPTCPGWTIGELARHTGRVHRWATKIVSTRADSRIAFPEADSPWESSGGWAQWLSAGAAPLLAALRAAGPDAACWTTGPGGSARWWARRMLHETTVHRADAELTLGTVPVIDPEVAADGIDEFLANLPTTRRPGPLLASLPAGESMHLHATDADGEWLVRFLGQPGIEWSRGHAKATAAVRGPVAELLLFAYGRIPPSDPRLSVFGDPSVLTAWQSKTAL
jgi:uncharacterized protein (TIGR03083 family)